MPTLQPAVHHALEEAYPAPLQCRQKAKACLQARRGSAGAHLPEHLLRRPTKTWGWGGHSCTADALKRVIVCISPECENLNNSLEHYNHMYIEEYAKKQLFGSIDKNKIPANLTDYNCELIIEDYSQVSICLLRAGKARSLLTSGSRQSQASRHNRSLWR